MFRSLLLILLFSFPLFASTNPLNYSVKFNEVFKLIREDGKLVAVKRRIGQRKNQADYHQMALELLLSAKADKSLGYAFDDLDLDLKSNQRENLIDALQKVLSLRSAELQAAMDHPMMIKHKNEFNELLNLFDPTVVAMPQYAGFFMIRKQFDLLIDRFKTWFNRSEDPKLMTVATIIEVVHQLFIQQGHFYRQMLLGFVRSPKAKELGLSQDEINTITSSLYEARIPLTNVVEYTEAKKNWKLYGSQKFYQELRTIRDLNINAKSYGIYFYVNESGYYHSLVNQHSFSQKKAKAYGQGDRVLITRLAAKLAFVGLNFIKLPNTIKNQAKNFLLSLYQKQELYEGSLCGALLVEQKLDIFKRVKLQQFNPLL